MNKLIWHIVKKDLRRFWPILGLRLLIMLAQAIILLYCIIRSGDYREVPILNSAQSLDFLIDYSAHTMIFSIFFWITDICFMSHLVINALQEDTPLGHRAFWRTRPITGAQLLVAKALFIALAICGLSALIQLGTVLSTGFSWPVALGAVGDYLLTQLAWIALAASFAVLWKNLMLGFGISACLSLAPFALIGLLKPEIAHFDWDDTSAHKAYLILLATGLAIPVWMYLLRRRFGGFAIFIVSVLFFYFLALMPEKDFYAYALVNLYLIALVAGSAGMLLLSLMRVASQTHSAVVPPGV
jgi:hypothetical protein